MVDDCYKKFKRYVMIFFIEPFDTSIKMFLINSRLVN